MGRALAGEHLSANRRVLVTQLSYEIVGAKSPINKKWETVLEEQLITWDFLVAEERAADRDGFVFLILKQRESDNLQTFLTKKKLGNFAAKVMD